MVTVQTYVQLTNEQTAHIKYRDVCLCARGSTAVLTALDVHVMHLARIAKTCFPLLHGCHYLLCRPEGNSCSL